MMVMTEIAQNAGTVRIRPSAKHMEEKLKRLRRASEEGDVAAVRELLESGEVDVNAVDDYMVRSL
jgi:hypothetical protein